jgi:hypothetical protein
MSSLLLSAHENGVHVDEVARRLGMPRAQILYISSLLSLSLSLSLSLCVCVCVRARIATHAYA